MTNGKWNWRRILALLGATGAAAAAAATVRRYRNGSK